LEWRARCPFSQIVGQLFGELFAVVVVVVAADEELYLRLETPEILIISGLVILLFRDGILSLLASRRLCRSRSACLFIVTFSTPSKVHISSSPWTFLKVLEKRDV